MFQIMIWVVIAFNVAILIVFSCLAIWLCMYVYARRDDSLLIY
jgi:hypothetical protein